MFPLGFVLFVLLEVLQWRNHEISENIGVGIKLSKVFVDKNITQSIGLINCSLSIQINFSVRHLFDAGLVTFAHILSTSPLFASFAILSMVSKVKKKGCFGKNSAILKSFLNWRNLHFLYILK